MDVICYAFSPDLIDSTEDELIEFLSILSQHFPKTENGNGGFKIQESKALLNSFNNAYTNVCQNIESKRIKKRHGQMFWLSLFTLLTLATTLAYTICTQT